jgi:hypothetical protein
VPTVSKFGSFNLLELSGSIKEVHYLSVIIKNHNFAFTVYGCETWSFKLTEKHRLRTVKNKVAKYILGLRGVYLQDEEENSVIEFGVYK